MEFVILTNQRFNILQYSGTGNMSAYLLTQLRDQFGISLTLLSQKIKLLLLVATAKAKCSLFSSIQKLSIENPISTRQKQRRVLSNLHRWLINHLSHVFSIQFLVNSEIYKLLLNPSLTHLTAQIAGYELKRDLSPVMLKENFHESLKISKFTSMENHSSVTRRHKLIMWSTNAKGL